MQRYGVCWKENKTSFTIQKINQKPSIKEQSKHLPNDRTNNGKKTKKKR